jgi:hypothetical protein
MAFSASDWRNRMSYYDNTYASLNFSWSNLGAAQGNRKYFTFWFSNASAGTIAAGYLSCTFYSFAPIVEAMVQNIDYVWYANEYYSNNYYAPYYQTTYLYGGSTGVYFPQSSFYSNTAYTAYIPGYNTTYYGYSFNFYQGTTYISQYNLVVTPSFFDQGTYRTFYNYKNGPYLSYYQYSLSNGSFTNYPFQTCTKEGAYYQCN